MLAEVRRERERHAFIAGEKFIIVEMRELEHLDFEEFLAAYESMTLALASHLRELASYREGR